MSSAPRARKRRRRTAPETFVFLGISGSGKGTQARRLARALEPSYYLEAGRLIRRVCGRRTVGGQFVTRLTKRGELMPDWVIHTILGREFLERVPPDVHIIGDGTPRRLAQVRFWDDVMADVGRPLPVAVYLTLSAPEARRRLLQRRRIDDTPSAIRRRFAYFRRDVLPVVAYYHRQGRLITVNGDQPVLDVWRDIRRALRARGVLLRS